MRLPGWAIIAPLLCMAGTSPVATESLDGSRWLLSALPPGDLLDRVTVTLNFEDGRVTGTDGCNRFGGSYTFEGGELRIGPLASTKRGCADPVMEQARAFTAVLDRARKASVTDETLRLSDADGELIAEFHPQLASLANTRWIVTGYNNGKQAVVSAGPGVSMTLEFDAGGAVIGKSACNNFRGNYSSGADTLTIGEIAATRRLCEDAVMAQEDAFLNALSRSATWRAEGNRLEIRDAGGAMLLMASLAEPQSSEN